MKNNCSYITKWICPSLCYNYNVVYSWLMRANMVQQTYCQARTRRPGSKFPLNYGRGSWANMLPLHLFCLLIFKMVKEGFYSVLQPSHSKTREIFWNQNSTYWPCSLRVQYQTRWAHINILCSHQQGSWVQQLKNTWNAEKESCFQVLSLN